MTFGYTRRALAVGTAAIGLLSHSALAQQAAPPAPPASQPVADAPAADAIIAASVKAVGGQEAIDKIKSLRAVMHMPIDNTEMTLESWWSRSGGRKSAVYVPGGDMVMVTDGSIGWMELPTGFELLNPDQADELRTQSCVFMNMLDPKLRIKETQASAKIAGQRDFGGKKCWILHLARPDGRQNNVLIDAQTSMPVGSEDIAMIGEKEFRSWIILEDWQEQGGVKLPHSMKVENSMQPGVVHTITIKSIEINNIDEKTFNVPADVKKLASGEGVSLQELTPEQQKTANETLERLRAAGNVEIMKQMVMQMRPAIAGAPLSEQASMRYLVQELTKEIEKRGG